MRINSKNIEKIFEKIDEKFQNIEYSEKISILGKLENKANIYNDEEVSQISKINIAFDNIKYHFSRVYCEGKSSRSLKTIQRHIDELEYEINNFQNYRDEQLYKMIKYHITCLQIMLNLELNFYTSLIDLYEECLNKEERNLNQEKEGRKKR